MERRQHTGARLPESLSPELLLRSPGSLEEGNGEGLVVWGYGSFQSQELVAFTRSKNKLNRTAQLFFAFLASQISYFIVCRCSCTARGAQVSSMPDTGREHSRVNTGKFHGPQGPLSAPTLALCPSSLDGQDLSQYKAFVTHKIECKSFYIYYRI